MDIPGHTDVTALRPESDDCRAVSAILARIGDKWSVLIVALLGAGPRRFNEIRRQVGGVSQRMLTLTLRGLERDGLVTRTVTPSTPRGSAGGAWGGRALLTWPRTRSRPSLETIR